MFCCKGATTSNFTPGKLVVPLVDREGCSVMAKHRGQLQGSIAMIEIKIQRRQCLVTFRWGAEQIRY